MTMDRIFGDEVALEGSSQPQRDDDHLVAEEQAHDLEVQEQEDEDDQDDHSEDSMPPSPGYNKYSQYYEFSPVQAIPG